MKYCIGFGSDNENTMKGEIGGVFSILKKYYCPYILDFGCVAHLLNLATEESYDNFRILLEFD